MIPRTLVHFYPLFPSVLSRKMNRALMCNYAHFYNEYRVLATIQKEFTKYLGVFRLIGLHTFQLANLQEPLEDISELLEPVLKNSWRTGKFPEKYDRLDLVFVFILWQNFTPGRSSFKKGTETNYKTVKLQILGRKISKYKTPVNLDLS